jgi:hypothetical protein
MRNSGYRLLVHESQDQHELVQNGNGLCVRGRGADHQVDVLGEFAFTPAFSLPIRLFLEAKFTGEKTGLPAVRNAHGVIHDINENFVHGPGLRLRKRFRYVYALFSAKGFTEDAQAFALAQQISLVDLSGASFRWLRDAVAVAAWELHRHGLTHRVQRFPVGWMRTELRGLLGTLPPVDPGLDWYPQTEASRFAEAAHGVIAGLAERLESHHREELLLGFPAAPFILPLAAADVVGFLAYANVHPEHRIRLRRTGTGSAAEWVVTPQGSEDGYRLTFSLPERLESWIGEREEWRGGRTAAVKKQFLSDIVIYRMEDDNLRTFQLKYEPSELRRSRG